MKYIALTGPMYSGKTTLRHALEASGYMGIGFADMLKKYACEALGAVGVAVTVEQINQNKQVYRAFLQCLGTLIDFDTNPEHVHTALLDWFSAGEPPAVFDNVRFNHQAEALSKFGFKVVEVRVPPDVQKQRAAALGVSSEELDIMMQHSCEYGVSNPFFSIDGTRPVEKNVEILKICNAFF